MAHSPLLIYHSTGARPAPPAIRDFAGREGFDIMEVPSAEEVVDRVSRSYPAAVIIDGAAPVGPALELCRRIKAETFTAVVPVIVHVGAGESPEVAAAALEAGADEVITPATTTREADLRLRLALRRAERDVSVHPTTRLPGTVQIERDFSERLRGGEKFAVCYADLDHFKEFNDRYGYHHGDRVILLVSRILRDVVRAHAPGDGFVGHIGGDDFIFTLALDRYRACCNDIVEVFTELIPLQYSEVDRERGFFTGKDRRGQEYEVPIMTLSIGVVTNEHRELTHTAEISELAAEMKTYAKSFPGSLYMVDRRTGKGGHQGDRDH